MIFSVGKNELSADATADEESLKSERREKKSEKNRKNTIYGFVNHTSYLKFEQLCLPKKERKKTNAGEFEPFGMVYGFGFGFALLLLLLIPKIRLNMI